jgi:ligand-binding sensor domain-containing protein/AraC-like DNA-binding protein
LVVLKGEPFAFHEQKHPEDYLVTTWTVENGLPQNTVQTLLQTQDGFLWIGTPSGLVRFDGITFKIFNRWNVTVLQNDNITCLYEDQNQTLWIGTEGGGVCTLKEGEWNHFSTANGLSSDFVRIILSDLNGDVWVGTDYGLNQFNRDGIGVYTEKDGLYDNTITALTVDNWNNLWVGTFRSGLAKFSQGSFSVFAYQEGLKNLSIRSLSIDQKGLLWIGTQEGLYYMKRNEAIIQPVKGTSYTPINAIIEKSPGELWIGTMVSGVKKMILPDLTRRTISTSLPDDFIHCIIKDNAENIWLGTDTEGLIQLKARRIVNITTEEGLPENATSAVFEDNSGLLWIGTKNNGLFIPNENRIINKRTGLSSNRISVIHEDQKGLYWIGTKDNGINLMRGRTVTSILTMKNGLSSNTITSILQDNTGKMWIGTKNGLNSYVNGQFFLHPRENNSEALLINVLLESQSRGLFVGTNDGVYRITKNSLKPIDQQLPSNCEVVSLYEDDSNELWIGTNGYGLFRWDHKKLNFITREGGLHDNYILSIQEDEQNNLWMSSHAGVFRVKKRELTNFMEKKISQVHSTWFSESEGMASRQCVGDGQPSVFISNDKQKLYTTVRGISILNQAYLKDYCTIPQLHIEYLFCGEDTIKINEEFVPHLNGDMISIGFTATEIAAPNKVRFRYKLAGYDDDFQFFNLGDNRIATYHYLSMGEYTFYLLAANNEGKWNEEATTISFVVNPPFFLTAQFFIIVIGISLTISSLFIYQAHRRKKQKQHDKYKTSALDPAKIEETINDLSTIMSNEKLYLDPDLTLRDLADRLKIHYNYISRIINEKFGMSYNDYVNKYRIDEVKKRFSDPKFADKTVLEIMYETGFYSKSVFNTAFKKFTGMTPSEYRKKSS